MAVVLCLECRWPRTRPVPPRFVADQQDRQAAPGEPWLLPAEGLIAKVEDSATFQEVLASQAPWQGLLQLEDQGS